MVTSVVKPLPASPILITPDARRRVTFPPLPGLEPNQAIEIIPEQDGSYRLVPIVTIPKNQLWAWTPVAMAKTGRALQEHHEGKSVPVDEFLSRLDSKSGK
jgi:hypothetical protein